MAIFPGSAIPSAVSDYEIDNSLRFEDADDSRLTKTIATSGNQKTITISFWFKRGNLGLNNTRLFSSRTSGSDEFEILLNTSNQLSTYFYSGSYSFWLLTTQLFRDPSAWYHYCLKYDSTPASPDSTNCSLYINGVQVTAFETETYPSQNLELPVNKATAAVTIGDHGGALGSYVWDGYIAEWYSIDGQALDADSFGELDSTTNQWKPLDSDDVKDAVTFGTNGFFQKYSATGTATTFADSSSSDHSITRNGDTTNARGADLDTTYSHIEPFTSTGSGTWTCPTGVTSAEILIVSGAGGGGYTYGGGGGAGGIVHHSTYSVTAGVVYDLTVGAGGAGGTTGSRTGTAGSDSVFNVNAEGSGIAMTASGGGGGASADSSSASAGGSGGGGSYGASHRTGGASDQGAVTGATVYGNDGGDGYFVADADYCSGGGGGASAVGADGAANQCGNGGAGQLFSNFTSYGASGYFGGGGGGSGGTFYSDSPGSGGSGGGGAGGADAPNNNGTAGTANTGGGGGGGGSSAGNGGSGVILIRYGLTKPGTSSIYFDGTGDSLELAASSDWDFGTGAYTVEGWIKTSDAASQFVWHGAGAANTTGFRVRVQATDGFLNLTEQVSGDHTIVSTTAVNDGNWHHWAISRVASEDSKMFIDGVHESTMDDNYNFDNDNVQMIGIKYGGNEPVDGYMDEVRVSNTARYTENFTVQRTEFSPDSNTKLLIHSNWDGGLGADSSGNFNNFTATNLVATDQMIDTPTNSFATINPLVKPNGTNTFSEGNLKSVAGSGWQASVATISASSGKWYYETLCGGSNQHCYIIGAQTERWFSGVASPQDTATGTIGYMGYDGNKRIDTVDTSYGATFGSGDVIAVALDLDAGTPTVTFYKNNASQGAITFTGNILNSSIFVPAFATLSQTTYYNFGADSSFAAQKTAQGNQDDNGKGDFYYTPPSGFLALCTDNLSTPEIALPGENFNTILYTGDGGVTQAETGVGFSPDFVWIKDRDSAYPPNLWDTVRGVQQLLESSSSGAESTQTDMLNVFDADGFTHGNQNAIGKSSDDYVAWNWKAGGAPTADNDNTTGAMDANSVALNGSLQAAYTPEGSPSIYPTKMSINTTSGFSTVKYAGNNTSGATVPHGLSETPELIIIKNTEAAVDWIVYSEPVGNTSGLQLNGDGDAYDYLAYFNDTSPTASVFSLGNYSGVNANTEDIIAYCFHSVEGYSKVGSYTANNSATDNTFVYTGFKPAWLMVKTIDAAGQLWTIWDNARNTYNTANKVLHPDDARAEETTGQDMDFYSNGFKPYNNSGPGGGGSTWTYLYLAFAESPFKTSNAR